MNIAIQLVLSGTLGEMFELLNTLQIIYFMPLLNFQYPPIVELIISFLSFVTVDFPVPGLDDKKSFLNRLINNTNYIDRPHNKNF